MVNVIFSPFWSPEWFRGVDLIIEIIVMFVVLFITFSSYRIYKLLKEKRFLHFSLAFFFITGAFFVRIGTYVLTFLIFTPVSATEAQEMVRQIAQISVIRTLGLLIPIILMLAAFITLISLNMRLKDKKLTSLLFILAFISSFLGVFLNQFWFYLVSTILLVYITHYFYCNYKKKKTTNSKLVFISFILFTLSQGLFAIAPVHLLSYVAAEIIQLISFIVLLSGFVLVKKKM